ncbi:MAG TPA: 3'(2'),5'-bisphosphate nucleotidase CysQ [Trebonia sp.]|nr:3'(2'),5'-bisphosphate nucleotidase CysQ [Trebonia sp.]
MPQLDDHALAADLAERAGKLLLGLRARGGEPDALRAAGDKESHEFLMAGLAKARPGDAVLSEEGIDDKARLTADRVWIVDPLDGTKEFGEPGRADWAVHVALWARTAEAPDGELIAGAVALPAQNRVLATEPGPVRTADPHGPGGAPADLTRTGGPVRAAGETALGDLAATGDLRQAERGTGAKRLRMVVSRSRASDLVKDVAARIDAELVPWGSAGAKAATVITGENDVYLHSGGFYEWDTAAPVAVARQRGLHVSRIDGSPVVYNRDNPLLPDILVCRSTIAVLLLNAIREATHAI